MKNYKKATHPLPLKLLVAVILVVAKKIKFQMLEATVYTWTMAYVEAQLHIMFSV